MISSHPARAFAEMSLVNGPEAYNPNDYQCFRCIYPSVVKLRIAVVRKLPGHVCTVMASISSSICV